MKTILLVEDEPDLISFMRHVLKHYHVVEATTAGHALSLFCDFRGQINLLIADLTLPTSSGIQVALRLRSRVPELPVILTSGYPINLWSDQDTAGLRTLGYVSVVVLQKPFSPQVLRDAVWQLIGGAEPAATKTA